MQKHVALSLLIILFFYSVMSSHTNRFDSKSHKKHDQVTFTRLK